MRMLEIQAKYPLLGVIGSGSMGIVYKSVDPRTGRPVALKTVRRELLDPEDIENLLARLRMEAQAARALTHQGIVAVHEYGEEEGYAYIVMEHVEGLSLQACFEQEVTFSIGRAVNIVSQLLEALQYAHDRGVWHRDVKPANILIMRNDQVKVTDFGIALEVKDFRIAQIGIAQTESPLSSQMGLIMGTPGYVAPETYLTDTFDCRIDVFAAGAVLYRMLAGAPPFAGTAAQVMCKVCYETPAAPSVAARAPELQPFDAVVLRALARRPEDRFPSAAQFRQALHEAHRRTQPGRSAVANPGS